MSSRGSRKGTHTTTCPQHVLTQVLAANSTHRKIVYYNGIMVDMKVYDKEAKVRLSTIVIVRYVNVWK